MNDEQKTRAEALQGFRYLISWYEEHPEIPLPELSITNYSTDQPELVARAMGTFEKRYDEGIVFFTKMFGPVKATCVFMRDQVCTRRVVGTREVEAVTIPAHTEEIVEWDCEPVFSKKEA